MAATRRRQDWSRPPRSLAVALRESGIMVVSSQNSAGYEHAGLQPEPHKGTPRIGSGTAGNPNLARTKTRPRPVFGAPGRTRTSNAAAAAIGGVRPGPDLTHPNR